MAAISFHDMLHMFWEGWGTGTSTLGANILQHITAMREEVLFMVFLDLQKSYNALYRERTLDVLATYKVGTRTVRLLQIYWD